MKKHNRTWISAVPRQPFFRAILGDPKQSPWGVADDLREHRALLLKAPIGLRADHRWFMPHEMPSVIDDLIQSSSEFPSKLFAKRPNCMSHLVIGTRWRTKEDHLSRTPLGASLQAAHKDLCRVNMNAPERLLVSLGHAITRPGHSFQFHQAAARSGVSGVHQWSVMPTSARVAQRWLPNE